MTPAAGVSIDNVRSQTRIHMLIGNQHTNNERSWSTKQGSSALQASDKKQKRRKKQPVYSDDEYEYTASDSEGDEDYVSDADTDDSTEIAATSRKALFADDGDEYVYQVEKGRNL